MSTPLSIDLFTSDPPWVKDSTNYTGYHFIEQLPNIQKFAKRLRHH